MERENKNNSSAAGADSFDEGHTAPPATWAWSSSGDALVTPEGRFVLYARARATCGRDGDDDYTCLSVKVRPSLFVDPALRALLASAPDLLDSLQAAHKRLRNGAEMDQAFAAEFITPILAKATSASE